MTATTILSSLTEEHELALADAVCVVVTLSGVDLLEWKILSITGPFLDVTAAINYGETTVEELRTDDPLHYEHVRYEVRALFAPSQ